MTTTHLATIISGAIVTPVFTAPPEPLPAPDDHKGWADRYASEAHWVNFYSTVKQHFAGMGQDNGGKNV